MNSVLAVVKPAAWPASRKLVEAFAGGGIVRARLVEMAPVALDLDAGHERAQRWPDLPDNAEVDVDAAPDRLRTDVDLRDAGLRGIERPIGKIGAEHQKRVAGFHGVIAGGKADQTGHTDVIRVLPLDVVLAAHGVNDWRFHRFGELHQLGMKIGRASCRERV